MWNEEQENIFSYFTKETFAAEKSYEYYERLTKLGKSFSIRELIFRFSLLLFFISTEKLKYLENFAPNFSKPSRQKDRELKIQIWIKHPKSHFSWQNSKKWKVSDQRKIFDVSYNTFRLSQAHIIASPRANEIQEYLSYARNMRNGMKMSKTDKHEFSIKFSFLYSFHLLFTSIQTFNLTADKSVSSFSQGKSRIHALGSVCVRV